MSTRHYACVLAILLLICGVSAEAQYVFALPASNGQTSTGAAFTGAPFTPSGTFLANPAASIALETSVGNKFYVISNSASNTVIAVDNTFSTVRPLASLGQAATAAIITPDGRRLFVAAGGLFGFDTSSDTALFGGTSSVSGAVDVAASLDGSRILVITNTSSGSTLFAIDPGTGQSLGSVNLTAFATGVSVAPNGLAYVSLQSSIAEIDPKSLTVRTQIQVNGRPGRLVYTADGKTGLAVNMTPFTGAGVFGFDLVNRNVSLTIPLSSFGNSTSFDKVLPITNNRALVPSAQSQTLFDVTFSPLSVTVFAPSGVGGAAAATISNDLATSNHLITQFVYFSSGTTLSRYDLSQNLLSGQATLPAPEGILTFTAGAITGTASSVLTYGDNQSVATSNISAPLVVRVVDSQGHPLSNVPVSFSTTSGAVLQTISAFTTADGFASTAVTAPTVAGPIAVSVLAGGIASSFTVNVGTSSGGGGGSGGLTIVAGQGQLVPDQSFTSFFGSSLTVQLKDAVGNPVPSSPITFTVTQGVGGLFGGNPSVVFTDASGMAKVDYQSGVAPVIPGYSTGIVTATAASGATVTFYITTVSNAVGATIQLTKPTPGTVLQGQAGTTLAGAVQAQVSSNNGGGIPFVSMGFINSLDDHTLNPAASCAGPPLSDTTGVINCDLVPGGKVGTFQLFAFVGSADFKTFPAPITLTVAAGPPGIVTIVQGNNQSGTPGTRLPVALLIQVTDAFGNILPGAPVTWKAATAGVTLSNIIATTDSTGRASVIATLGNTAGQQQVTATVGSITQTFTLTVNIPVAGLQLVSGNLQTAVVNTAFGDRLVVKVVNASNPPAPVQGATVTFAVTGSATVNPTSTITDANGIASTAVQAGANPGPITITASSQGFSTVFNLTSRLPGPTNVSFLNGASFQPGIAPGSIATITGTGIATGVQGTVTAGTLVGPLQNSLAGVSVTFNGTTAPIYSVSNINGNEQVTVQVPFEVAPGTATVVINAAGGGSGTINNVTIQSLSPGVFQLPGAGNFAVLVRPDGSFVSQDNPIRRGEVIRLYATGLGQVGPTPTSTNRVGVANQDVLASIVVGLNNQGIPFISARTLPGVVGVYEVAFQVPPDTAAGPSQPIGLIVTDSAGNTFTAGGTVAPIQ